MTRRRDTAGYRAALRALAEQRVTTTPGGDADAPYSNDRERLLHELRVHQVELELQNEELQRSRVELEEALARATDLYEFAPVGYFTVGRDGVLRETNLTGARLLGQERAHLAGRRLASFVAPKDHEALGAMLGRALSGPGTASCEVVLLSPGTAPPLTLELTGVTADEGQTCRVAATDVTARRRAEAALASEREVAEQRLQVSDERYHALFNGSHDLVYVLGLSGRLLDANEAGLRALAVDRAAIGSLSLATMVVPEDAALAERTLEELRHTGRQAEVVTLRLRGAGGSPVEVEVSGSLVTSLGRAANLQLIARDVTEQRRLQTYSAQADRLASMGMLAAGIAHEINNPLTFVLATIESLADEVPRFAGVLRRGQERLVALGGPGQLGEVAGDAIELLRSGRLEELVTHTRDALGGVLRIRDIARGLAAFARAEVSSKTPVDVNQAVEAAVQLAQNELRYRGELVRAFTEVPPVLASDGRLTQVVLNLLINAAHALDGIVRDRHRVTVRTRTDGESVFIDVEDTGCGIAPENFSRVFEPFYSTKKRGAGSGLGLAISRNIVTEFGGALNVRSTQGAGACFTVRLPVAVEPPVEAPPLRPALRSPAPRGRVLIIDDEPIIRSMVARVLATQHQVVTAGSGSEAQALLQREAPFDVVLCDLMMPGMNGIELHAWLKERHPEQAARFVFVTGGAFTPRATEYLAAVPNRTVEKPFDVKTLKALVEQLVHESQTGLATSPA